MISKFYEQKFPKHLKLKVIFKLVSVTPVLKILGLPDEGTSWIWLASPIFGLTVGPFIGSWSDR